MYCGHLRLTCIISALTFWHNSHGLSKSVISNCQSKHWQTISLLPVSISEVFYSFVGDGANFGPPFLCEIGYLIIYRSKPVFPNSQSQLQIHHQPYASIRLLFQVVTGQYSISMVKTSFFSCYMTCSTQAFPCLAFNWLDLLSATKNLTTLVAVLLLHASHILLNPQCITQQQSYGVINEK